ncbi:hypothetical protein ABW19_dt0206197 [Dactylella cylindrospora]|nr:hypothetical protein ABW19_dt0206197 [Dactylella cylindrospora]
MFGALALQELPPIAAYLDLLEPPVDQQQQHQQQQYNHQEAENQHNATAETQQIRHANMQPTSVATPPESRLTRSRRESVSMSTPRIVRTPPPPSIISPVPPISFADIEEAQTIESAVDLAQRALEEATSFARHSASRRNRERQRYQESSPPLSRRSTDERSSNSGYGSRPTTLRPGERQWLYGWAPLSTQSTSQQEPRSQITEGNTTSTPSLEAMLRRDILPRAPSPPRRRQTQASPANAAPGSTPPPSRPLRSFRLIGNQVSEQQNTQSPTSHIAQLPPRRWQEWLDAMNGYEDDRDTNSAATTPQPQPQPQQQQQPQPPPPQQQQQSQAPRVTSSRSRSSTSSALLRETRPARKQPVEEAIRYLTRIQDIGFHWTIDEAEGLISCIYGNNVPENCLDFITDMNTLYVAPTSWLVAGSVYTGAQYATQQKPPTTSGFRPNLTTATSSSEVSRVGVTTDSSNPLAAIVAQSEKTEPEEHWNVTVVIQEVDHARNRICGSMRAYDVPDWQSATGTSSINTFWEGEIIDFHNNGLETLNLPSNTRIDGNYWRKLDPFAGYTDSELAQKLTSRQFLEELAENYVLMRWKG